MLPTREHWKIQRWAHRNAATPAQALRLHFDGEPPNLTFLFPMLEATSSDVSPISWESFFAQFDALELSMVFEEVTARFEIVRVGQKISLEIIH